MKGIILAGGTGTRLHPVTIPTCKQLLPVYDKPMVYYSLAVLMLAGVRDVLIISTPKDLPRFRELFRDGADWGLKIFYEEQPEPKGIAQALIIGEKFISSENVWLILGDNIFFGQGLPQILKETAGQKEGASVFGYCVSDPERYGVVEFDAGGNAVSIEEKPREPRSNYAVTGLYYYDGRAPEIAKALRPSGRGELEITSLNNEYLKMKQLKVRLMGRGMAWLDTGTHESLLEASEFVRIVERRQGLKIACIEEIAYRCGYIDRKQLESLTMHLGKSTYGEYLRGVLSETAQ